MYYPADFMSHELSDFTGSQVIQYDRPTARRRDTSRPCLAVLSFKLLLLSFVVPNHASGPALCRIRLLLVSHNHGDDSQRGHQGALCSHRHVCRVLRHEYYDMFGPCAEPMSHYAGFVLSDLRSTFDRLVWPFHTAGWVLFLFAMITIWRQTQIAHLRHRSDCN
jgi:hypothetical protein